MNPLYGVPPRGRAAERLGDAMNRAGEYVDRVSGSRLMRNLVGLGQDDESLVDSLKRTNSLDAYKEGTSRRVFDAIGEAGSKSPYMELDPLESLRNRLVDKLPEGVQGPFRSPIYHATEALKGDMPEPSMGTEILGERGAPYQDIGEQRSTMEDQIRLLIEMQRNPEFGGPAGYGLPSAPQEVPPELGPRFRPEGPYGHGAGHTGEAAEAFFPTPKGPLDAMELRHLPRRYGNEILLPELGGEAMPR